MMENCSEKERPSPETEQLKESCLLLSGVSKNQLKRLRKKQKWEENKGEKRKREKEKKRAKRQAMRDAGIEAPMRKKVTMAHPDASAVRVALDLSFNHLMTEKDQRKIVKQVVRSYSMNRQAQHPLQLYLTNFDEINRELFDKSSPGHKTWDVHFVGENHLQEFNKSELVYLSSDSSNILQELDDQKVYIIGGIVDHNAHKGMCFKIAEEAGIGHARLPIGEYIKLEGRKVLPVNHVFEILLHFAEFSDWEKAFYHVIPKRKGLTSHLEQLKEASVRHSPNQNEDVLTSDTERDCCPEPNTLKSNSNEELELLTEGTTKKESTES